MWRGEKYQKHENKIHSEEQTHTYGKSLQESQVIALRSWHVIAEHRVD